MTMKLDLTRLLGFRIAGSDSVLSAKVGNKFGTKPTGDAGLVKPE
jgi:hypothetical protein